MFDDLDDDQLELEEPIDKPLDGDDDEDRTEAARRKGMKKYTVSEVGDDVCNLYISFLLR